MPDGSMTQASVWKTMCVEQLYKNSMYCRFTLMGVGRKQTWIP